MAAIGGVQSFTSVLLQTSAYSELRFLFVVDDAQSMFIFSS
jgi:hypothetical protein